MKHPKKDVPPLRFGPGGVSEHSKERDSLAGIERVRQVGLGCMELEWVRSVSMGEVKARRVHALATELDVSLSVHAPYYINLNAKDREILEASKRRLFEAARMGSLCGARSVIFHPGSYMGGAPRTAFRNIKRELIEVRRRLKAEGVDIQLRPETTGRPSHFGTLDEMLALCEEVEGVAPCLDFAHMHAFAGKINTFEEFAEVLERVRSRLGKEALADLHIHLSGIRFGAKGELEHLDLGESDMNYRDLVRALRNASAGGRVICESRRRETDALLLKRIYDSL
jgi:deoxyribonuclease-4